MKEHILQLIVRRRKGGRKDISNSALTRYFGDVFEGINQFFSVKDVLKANDDYYTVQCRLLLSDDPTPELLQAVEKSIKDAMEKTEAFTFLTVALKKEEQTMQTHDLTASSNLLVKLLTQDVLNHYSDTSPKMWHKRLGRSGDDTVLSMMFSEKSRPVAAALETTLRQNHLDVDTLEKDPGKIEVVVRYKA